MSASRFLVTGGSQGSAAATVRIVRNAFDWRNGRHLDAFLRRIATFRSWSTVFDDDEKLWAHPPQHVDHAERDVRDQCVFPLTRK